MNDSKFLDHHKSNSRLKHFFKKEHFKKQHFKKQQIKQQLYKKNYLFTKQHTAPCWWITLWINLSLEGATANWRLLVVLRAKTTAVYSITASAPRLSKRQRRPAAPRQGKLVQPSSRRRAPTPRQCAVAATIEVSSGLAAVAVCVLHCRDTGCEAGFRMGRPAVLYSFSGSTQQTAV